MARTRKQFANEVERNRIRCIDCAGVGHHVDSKGAYLMSCSSCDLDGWQTLEQYDATKAEMLERDSGELVTWWGRGDMTWAQITIHKHEGGRRPTKARKTSAETRQWLRDHLAETILDMTRDYHYKVAQVSSWERGYIHRPALTVSFLRDEAAQWYDGPTEFRCAGNKRQTSMVRSVLTSMVTAGELDTVIGLSRNGKGEARQYEPTTAVRDEIVAAAERRA